MPRNLLVFIILYIFCLSCVEKDFDPNDPQKSFAIAKKPYDDGNYEMASKRLQEFSSRFPYSIFAKESDLLIADCHFQLGHYVEAASAYDQFIRLHPKHPKKDFALFHKGNAFLKESPDTYDREQEYREKAIEVWRELLKTNPNSEFTNEVKILIEENTQKLAESLKFRAEFNCRKEHWHACAFLHLKLMERFSEFSLKNPTVLSNAADALDRLAQGKTKPSDETNLYYKNFSKEELAKKAEELRKKIKIQ